MTITSQQQIKTLEKRDKKYNRGCGDGLYVQIYPNGSKYFWGEVRKKNLNLGSTWIGTFGSGADQYSYKEVKSLWHEIKKWSIKELQHPKNYKKKDLQDLNYTLLDAINGFLLDIKDDVKEGVHREYSNKLNNQVLKYIPANTPIKKLEWDSNGRRIIKNAIDKIADGRKYDLARRCRQLLKQVFDFAIYEGYMKRGQNPAITEKKDRTSNRPQHHKSIGWNQVPDFLGAINLNRCNQDKQTIICTKLMLLTALRTGAVTRLKWEWIKPINGIDCIVIDGSTSGLKRRKGKSDHIPHHIPITNQIKNLLDQIKELSGNNEYIFPSYRDNKYPHIDPEAPNNFLKKIGYEGALVAHGWRRVFNTTCKEELKQSQEIIKLQMGHLPDNKVDKAYDGSLMLAERKELLAQWCSLLVKTGLRV